MLVVEAWYRGELLNYWIFKDKNMAKEFLYHMEKENPKVEFKLTKKDTWDSGIHSEQF